MSEALKERGKVSEWNKPPIGASPHWFVHYKRIKDLNDAINRYLEYTMEHIHTRGGTESYKCIAEWAREIEMVALLEAELLVKGGEE